ncbi:MAG: surface-adhesin E family protein [Sulfuricellaceae bacterium]
MKTHRAQHIAWLLLLSLCAGFPAAAGNWKQVANDNKTRVEIDVASLVAIPDENIAKAWERETHAKPKQAKPGDFFFTMVKTLAQYHCTDRTTTYLYRAYYDADGSEIKAMTTSADLGKVDFLVPDSLEERKLIFACTYKKPVAKKTSPVAPPEAVEKTSEAPSPVTQPPDEKDAQKSAAPAKSAAKGGKSPPTDRPETAEKKPPDTTAQSSPASSGKASAGK